MAFSERDGGHNDRSALDGDSGGKLRCSPRSLWRRIMPSRAAAVAVGAAPRSRTRGSGGGGTSAVVGSSSGGSQQAPTRPLAARVDRHGERPCRLTRRGRQNVTLQADRQLGRHVSHSRRIRQRSSSVARAPSRTRHDGGAPPSSGRHRNGQPRSPATTGVVATTRTPTPAATTRAGAGAATGGRMVSYYDGWYGGGYWGYPYGGWGSTHYYVHRDIGSVRVLVDPSEARVYVDGYYAGTVDDFDGLFQRLNVSPGRHEITLKLEGYKTHRVKVYVPFDEHAQAALRHGEGLGRDVRGPGGQRPRERAAARARRERSASGERPGAGAAGQATTRTSPARHAPADT